MRRVTKVNDTIMSHEFKAQVNSHEINIQYYGTRECSIIESSMIPSQMKDEMNGR